MRTRETAKKGVLFVHTATRPPLGADTWIHAQLMRVLDRSTFDLYAACIRGPVDRPTPTYAALSGIPDVDIVPADLGPELSLETTGRGKLCALLATIPAIASLAGLARFVRRNGIELIHTSDRPRDALASVLLARLTGATCIVHSHVTYGAWMSKLLRWSIARADASIAISQFVARSVVLGGRDEARTFVVLNAIDSTAWTPGAGRAEARRELGLGERTPVVVTVCRLIPGKGVTELIRALAEVRVEEPEAQLVVVGADMTPDGSYSRQLNDLVASLGLDGHVIFTGHRYDVARLMAAADVFALASLEEPFGLVYLEAMAMELPVVAFDSGGTPEVVDDGQTGLLAAAGDVDGLTERLLCLIRDPDLRRAMGTHGRKRVEEHFTLERMGREVAQVYRRLTSPAPAEREGTIGAGHAGAVTG